jgi:hypothetical protein
MIGFSLLRRGELTNSKAYLGGNEDASRDALGQCVGWVGAE